MSPSRCPVCLPGSLLCLVCYVESRISCFSTLSICLLFFWYKSNHNVLSNQSIGIKLFLIDCWIHCERSNRGVHNNSGGSQLAVGAGGLFFIFVRPSLYGLDIVEEKIIKDWMVGPFLWTNFAIYIEHALDVFYLVCGNGGCTGGARNLFFYY